MAGKTTRKSVTVLLAAGQLPLGILQTAHDLAKRYNLEVYLSTMQNLRLTGISPEHEDEVRLRLQEAGATFKAPGKFPVPRVCIGKEHCGFGIVDTRELSRMILDRFEKRSFTKAKYKIAIAGCTMCCSSPKTTDIGIVATRNGLELYVGGKGGPNPRVARRIGRNMSMDEVLDVLAELVAFHDRKTSKKQRFCKLLEDPEFTWKEI